MALEYLCELVSIRKSSPKLRSSGQIILQVPVSGLKSYGDCAFSVAVPTLLLEKQVSSLENLNPF